MNHFRSSRRRQHHIIHRKISFVEVFNKKLEHALTNICNMSHDGWDHKILVILWYYPMTCNKLMGHAPFRLIYGKEVFMPMEYVVPRLRIDVITEITYVGSIEERLPQLLQLE